MNEIVDIFVAHVIDILISARNTLNAGKNNFHLQHRAPKRGALDTKVERLPEGFFRMDFQRADTEGDFLNSSLAARPLLRDLVQQGLNNLFHQ